MATKIQLRRDSSTNWTSTNPTLSQGEMGVETDTGKFKIGDGTSNWVALSYAVPDGYSDADVDTHLNTSTATSGQVLSYTGADYDWVDAGGGGAAAQVSVTAVGTNGNYKIPFIDSNNSNAQSGDYGLQIDNTSGDFYYNPSLNRLYADYFVGNGSLLTGITASTASNATMWNSQNYYGSYPSSGDIIASNGSGWQDYALTAGANVTITQDNGAKTITIASTGGGGGGGSWYSLNTSSPMTLPADFDSSYNNMSSTKAMAWGADSSNTNGGVSYSWSSGGGTPTSMYWMSNYDPSGPDLDISMMGTGNYVILSTHYDSASWSGGSANYYPSSGFGSSVGSGQLSNLSGSGYSNQEAWGMTLIAVGGATVTGGVATVAETFELYPGSNKTAFVWSLDNAGCQAVGNYQDALQFSTSGGHETIYFHRYLF